MFNLSPIGFFYKTPKEIVEEIASYLNIQELSRLSRVCKNFQRIIDQDKVWKKTWERTYTGGSSFPFLPWKEQVKIETVFLRNLRAGNWIRTEKLPFVEEEDFQFSLNGYMYAFEKGKECAILDFYDPAPGICKRLYLPKSIPNVVWAFPLGSSRVGIIGEDDEEHLLYVWDIEKKSVIALLDNVSIQKSDIDDGEEEGEGEDESSSLFFVNCAFTQDDCLLYLDTSSRLKIVDLKGNKPVIQSEPLNNKHQTKATAISKFQEIDSQTILFKIASWFNSQFPLYLLLKKNGAGHWSIQRTVSSPGFAFPSEINARNAFAFPTAINHKSCILSHDKGFAIFDADSDLKTPASFFPFSDFTILSKASKEEGSYEAFSYTHAGKLNEGPKILQTNKDGTILVESEDNNTMGVVDLKAKTMVPLYCPTQMAWAHFNGYFVGDSSVEEMYSVELPERVYLDFFPTQDTVIQYIEKFISLSIIRKPISSLSQLDHSEIIHLFKTACGSAYNKEVQSIEEVWEALGDSFLTEIFIMKNLEQNLNVVKSLFFYNTEENRKILAERFFDFIPIKLWQPLIEEFKQILEPHCKNPYSGFVVDALIFAPNIIKAGITGITIQEAFSFAKQSLIEKIKQSMMYPEDDPRPEPSYVEIPLAEKSEKETALMLEREEPIFILDYLQGIGIQDLSEFSIRISHLLQVGLATSKDLAILSLDFCLFKKLSSFTLETQKIQEEIRSLGDLNVLPQAKQYEWVVRYAFQLSPVLKLLIQELQERQAAMIELKKALALQDYELNAAIFDTAIHQLQQLQKDLLFPGPDLLAKLLQLSPEVFFRETKEQECQRQRELLKAYILQQDIVKFWKELRSSREEEIMLRQLDSIPISLQQLFQLGTYGYSRKRKSKAPNSSNLPD